MTRALSSVAAVSLAALLFSVSSTTAETEAPTKVPGDLWEVATEMSMAGMTMPARTSKHCSPKEWNEPPAGDPENKCETLAMETTGSRVTWKIRCPGPPPMTGEGEVTRSENGYTGWMKMTAPQGEMNMKITGRRVGDCDAPVKKQGTKK